MIRANKLLTAVVGDVVRKAPLTPEKVTFAWRLAVGPAIAKATTVRLDTDGTLYLKAESQAWVDSVMSSAGMIRTRLAHFLGDDTVKRFAYE